MASAHFSLTSGVAKIALGSVVGAGLALIAYGAFSGKRSVLVANDEGRAVLGWQLRDKKVVVVEESGKSINSTVSFLLRAGAIVTIVSSGKVDKALWKIQPGTLHHWNRPFAMSDLSDYVWDFVFYAIESSPDVIDDIVAVCRKKRTPIHLANRPDMSDFWINANRDRAGKYNPAASTYAKPASGQSKLIQTCVTSDTNTPQDTPLGSESCSFVDIGDKYDSFDTPEVVIGIFDGYAVARYVGGGFADVLYDFSFAEDSSSFFSRSIEKSPITSNIFGKQVKILLMDVRSGAGGALYGTLVAHGSIHGDSANEFPFPNGGTRGHALIPSSGLIEMAPILAQLAQENIPCVIHSAVAHIADDLTISPDLSDIFAIQHTGVHLINSTNPQEVHDLGVISHIASQLLSAPFVHFFDLKTTARTATTVSVLSRPQVLKLVESSQALVVEKNVKSKTKLVSNVVDAVMTHVQQTLGKKYEIFQYTGSKEAEVVFVSVGDASAVVRDTVDAISPMKVGSIVVHLLRPWDSERFVTCVPPSVKKIIVLGPVFSEVVASFHLAACKGPIVLKVQNASSYVITPTVVLNILEHTLSSPRSSHVSLPLPAKDSNISSQLAPQSSIIGEIWEEPNEEIAVNINSLLAQTKLSVAASTNIGLLAPETPDQQQVPRVKSTIFQLANGYLSTVDSANQADFLIVYDTSVLKKINIFANLKTSGTLVLHWPFSMQELEEKLPNATKREIAGKRIKLFTFEVPSGKSKLPVQLSAFFAFSGLLPELGGWHTLSTSLRSDKRANISLFLQNMELLTKSQPIPIPRGWIDAPENQDLLPPPKSRFIPKKITKQTAINSQEAIKYLMFQEAYSTSEKLRPDIPGAHLVKVTVNRRLTPADYERNVFHIEFDTTGTDLKYEIGEALAVHGHNDTKEVEAFLKYYGLNPNQLVALPFKGSKPGQMHVKTVEHIFTQYLDLFGRPSKEFYLQLAEYATDPKEKEKLTFLTTSEGQADYKARVDNTVTFEDVLLEFPSAHPSLDKLIELIPPIKPRHYSIASSMKMHPNSVHLLVVLVNWETKQNKKRFGHCTRYLSGLVPGDIVTVSVKPSVMTLPPLDAQPIVMAGLGTGMAPFRAFIQERAVLKAQGIDVGPIALYFGSRSRFAEYLYGEELEAYSKEGLLTHLRLAFSRDQQEKIYIQHKINEDKDLMWKFLVVQKGHFYLCGPTWPEADVRGALISSFESEGSLSKGDAEGMLEKIRSDERYILELY